MEIGWEREPNWGNLFVYYVHVEEPTSFLDHVYFGCTQTQRENHSTIQQDVRVPYFCWSNRKITRMGQTSRENFGVVLRHGRTALRIGKQEDSETFQGFKSLFGRSPNSKGRIGKQM